MKIRILLIVLILVVLNTLAGCSGGDGDSNGNGTNGQWVKESGKRIDEPYFFDVSVVKLDDGRCRMYGEMYADIESYISNDGLSWQYEGVRLANAGFPYVMRLSDGRWRMYYSPMGDSQNHFLSAVSSDGLNFEVEEGHRYDAESNYEDRIQSSRVIELDDGTYKMYYTALTDPDQPEEIVRILSAKSADGFIWVKEEGIRIDPSVSPLIGTRVAHAWPIKTSAGDIKLYFAGLTTEGGGIISATANDGLNFTVNLTPELANWGPEIHVGDPCVGPISGGLRMYYGVYRGADVISESGIYSATNTTSATSIQRLLRIPLSP